MSWDKSLLLGPVFALDTLRNRVNTTLKNNQNRNNTQQGDYPIFLLIKSNPSTLHLDDRLVFLDEDLSYQARGMNETLPQGIAQHS